METDSLDEDDICSQRERNRGQDAYQSSRAQVAAMEEISSGSNRNHYNAINSTLSSSSSQQLASEKVHLSTSNSGERDTNSQEKAWLNLTAANGDQTYKLQDSFDDVTGPTNWSQEAVSVR